MNQHQASINRVWSQLILEAASRHGVRHVCIAPGSRSTPLTLEADEHPELTIHTHFDERGLGFLALGLAKALDAPVAVVVTSGTAVANLLPAVAEAGLTGEKLVLLTADRPQSLVDVGANQAIRQQGIFSHHVSEALNLPSPSLNHDPCWLVGSIDALLGRLQHGPVHINCPFPEPLYGGDKDEIDDYLKPLASWLTEDTPYDSYQLPTPGVTIPLEWQSLQAKKGVVIAGELPEGLLSEVKVLARRLGWPLLADPQSGGSSAWHGYDLWLANPQCRDHLSKAEVVLQLGARLVSKRLGEWLGTFEGDYWLVDHLPARLQSQYRRHCRIQADIGGWIAAVLTQTDHPTEADWASELAALPEPQLDDELTEAAIATHVLGWLPPRSDLFIGNSLIIRLIDMLSSDWQHRVYANRGASGIDGLIATFAGVQRGNGVPMLALLGDTSALYDLNSLALLRQPVAPLVVVVINNDGGGIFDMLPVPEQQKVPLYRMPHGMTFSHAAQMFGLDYCHPTTLSALQQAIQQGFATAGTTLIEVTTPPGQAGEQIKSLLAEARDGTLLV